MKKGILVICAMLLFAGCTAEKKVPTKPKTEKKEEIVEASFASVGDNLIHEAIYYYNKKADGSYDFNYMYEDVAPIAQSVDVAYLNQETPCGGEALGLSHYPSFNGPYEILDAVVNAGFNWVNFASNHSFDAGEDGILNELSHIRQYDGVYTSGVHASEAEAKEHTVIEKNGMRIGVLAYTYGLNGYVLPEGKEYLADLIDKEKIKEDMKELSKISDVQLVSMHWGNEYQFDPSQEQQELAQYLSDLGVDVIIGAHPHVIQPMTYVEGKEGNKTLVIYSMGNFLSGQDENYRMLGLMPTWKMSYNKGTKEVQFSDVKVYPTVTLISNNTTTFKTYLLANYTDELAAQHSLHIVKGQDLSRQYFIDLVNSVIGDTFEIVY